MSNPNISNSISPNVSPNLNVTSRFRYLPITGRLLLAFGFLILLMAMIVLTAFSQINRIKITQANTVNAFSESYALLQIETAFYKGLEAETSYVAMQTSSAPEDITQAETAWNASLAQLDGLELEAEEQENHARLKTLLDQAGEGFQESIAFVQAGDIKGAQENHRSKLTPLAAEISDLFDESISQGILTDVKKAEQTSDQAASTGLSWILILGGLSIVAGLISAIGIAYGIAEPVRQLTNAAQAISNGNLDIHISHILNNELGVLASTFNQMTAHLRDVLHREQAQKAYLQATVSRYMDCMTQVAQGNLAVQITVDDLQQDNDSLVALGQNLNEVIASTRQMTAQIKKVVEQLNNAAAEILTATMQQANGANEQSAATSQTTATIEEVKTIAEQNALRVQEVRNTAQQTVNISRAGQQAVRDSTDSMNQIKDQVNGIAENILMLAKQTQQIDQIVSAMRDIAAQSNMLALNASVEAARAGEQGKSFAIVASEVRQLSEQSRRATQQVKLILADIQKATDVTVFATEAGARRVAQGLQLVEQASQAIDQLATSIDLSAQTAAQMATSGQQQVNGMDQAAVAMQIINEATQQSLASSRQTESAAQNLHRIARDLAELTTKYHLETGENNANAQ